MRRIYLLFVSLLALLYLAGSLTPVHAFGFYGHVCIGEKAGKELGFTGNELDLFVLGAVMGDLDKSHHMQHHIRGNSFKARMARWVAKFGNEYSYPDLVNLHGPDQAAILCEEAAKNGDRRLMIWALGVLSHGIADRITDNYPNKEFRVSTADEELSTDFILFKKMNRGRFDRKLGHMEWHDQVVFGARPRVPWTWWLFGVDRALKEGKNRNGDVRKVNPFAELILKSHKNKHGDKRPGPMNVSDICRQQMAFDAFLFNYRLKASFFPGWMEFASEKGNSWFRTVRKIVEDELVPTTVDSIRKWLSHLERLADGKPSARPTIP